MLQLIWFIAKIGILTAGAVWLAYRPGSVTIEWMNYEITIHFGFFLLLFFLLLLLTVGLTRLLLYFRTAAQRYGDRRAMADTEKGLTALTLSLSAAASGDPGYTQYHAARAKKLLPGRQPLPVLLHAHALRQENRHEEADGLLKDLLKHREGGALAARALIANALSENNLSGALFYARQTDRDYKGKDDGWLLKTLYSLEARSAHWPEAAVLLDRLVKKKLVETEPARSDKVAILTAWGLEKQQAGQNDEAIRLLKGATMRDPGFTPAAGALARLYIERNDRRAAVKLIERAWQKNPHPDLVPVWTRAGALASKPKSGMAWTQRLIAKNPDHIESLLLQAKEYMVEQDWSEVRTALEKAAEISSERRVYRLWAQLDEQSGKSEASVRHRLEQMMEMKADPVWICTQTGRVYKEWAPVALPHGSFNTVVWASPDDIHREAHDRLAAESSAIDLITVSASA